MYQIIAIVIYGFNGKFQEKGRDFFIIDTFVKFAKTIFLKQSGEDLLCPTVQNICSSTVYTSNTFLQLCGNFSLGL
jgi:hypothetical protein